MSGDGTISAKLTKLSGETSSLLACAALCRSGAAKSISEAQCALLERLHRCRDTLRAQASGCRLPAMAALAEAQLSYRERTGTILKTMFPDTGQEALSLYAEYAADFALSALLDAQLAALAAVSAQEIDASPAEKEDIHE